MVRRSMALLIIVLASTIAICGGTLRADSGDISEYYGFQEMEIVKLDWGTKDLQIADFNSDGRNDIAVVNNRKARIELLIQKDKIGPDEADVAVEPDDTNVNVLTPPTRFSRQSVAVSQKLYSLATGDLNSDGLVDLAFYAEPKGLYVVLQNGDSSGSEKSESLGWLTKKKISIDDGLPTSNALACADLNGDGRHDLALGGNDGVYIILQKDDGSLAEPVKYPSSGRTLTVRISDFNGDGTNDLVLITNDQEYPIHVRFGLATGQLGPQMKFHIERPSAIILKNIDDIAGDEVLTVDSLSGRLVGYKLDSESRPDAEWPILSYPIASGQEEAKRDLAVGDFDGDGLIDVTITDPATAELFFYRQAEGIGLAEPVRFPAFAEITSVSAADIDHDGKTELGVLSVKEKVIGLSKFENARLSFPRPLSIRGEPLAMELTDVDGDKEVDCLYISKDADDKRFLRAVYNLSAFGRNGTAVEADSGGSAGTELELKELTANPEGLKVFDADQDGLEDVLIFVSYESPILVRQVEKNKFQVVDSAKTQGSLIKEASLRSIALADVDDKPGLELLVAQKSFARSLVLSGGRKWTVVDQYNAQTSAENEISAVAAFDIDGTGPDTRPAILLLDGRKGQLQILRPGSDKTYRVDQQLDVGTWNVATHMKMLFAPFTGGKAKSLMLFDGQKFALVTPPGGTDGGRHLVQEFSYETRIRDAAYGNLAAGDINSDGCTDIIAVDYKRNYLEILTLAGAKPIPAMRFKVFEQKSYREAQSSAKVSVEPRELEVADVTGDGKNDLVTLIHDRIIVYPQD